MSVVRSLCSPGSRRPLRAQARVAALLACALGAAAANADAAPAPFEDTIGQRVLACTGCHGREGRATPDGYFPRIAGKPSGYLFNQLRNFRDQRRRYELMGGLVALLDDAYLREIADHFASLDVPYPAPPAPVESASVRAVGEALVRRGDATRGVPACSECHGARMTGVLPFVPGLLGLPRDYLNAQLGAWRNGTRRADAPDCMAQVAQRLSVDDIGAVSAWLAAQPVPAHATPAAASTVPLPMACGGVDATTPRPAAGPGAGPTASSARR